MCACAPRAAVHVQEDGGVCRDGLVQLRHCGAQHLHPGAELSLQWIGFVLRLELVHVTSIRVLTQGTSANSAYTYAWWRAIYVPALGTNSWALSAIDSHMGVCSAAGHKATADMSYQ